MRNRSLLTASALLTLLLMSGAAQALPPGYNRNLARQQLANATLTAHARSLISLKASQSMGSRLATNDRFVDDKITELQSGGLALGIAQLGTDGGRVLDAILAAQASASAARSGVNTQIGADTGIPAARTPATKESTKQTIAGAQATVTAGRGTPSTSLTSVTDITRTPGRDSSLISDVDNPNFWDFISTGGNSNKMDQAWDKKYGPKPPCGDDGDPMCGYQFTGGGASMPNPDAGPKRSIPTNIAPGSLINPRNGSHVTNPAPDSTTGGTGDVDRTAPMPTLPGGGVVNPGGPENVRTPITITEKPIISNTNVINPDRSNGAPTDPGQAGNGSQGAVGTPGKKPGE